MGQGTEIAWATDTWNIWIGCTKWADECRYCYADQQDLTRFSKTLGGGTKEQPIRHWGKGAPRYLTSDKTLLAPYQWNKRPCVCSTCGHVGSTLATVGCACSAPNCLGYYERRRVFCGSLMDWADEEVSDSWRDRAFEIAEACTDLTFLFLTKRGEKMHRYVQARYGENPPRHFWWGLSWMHQKSAEIEWLLRMPGPVRWLSVEPMLGPVDLAYAAFNGADSFGKMPGIDWVIFGGESGDNARPCNIEWIRDGVRQCRDAGVNPFVKQLGRYPFLSNESEPGAVGARIEIALRDPKGGDSAEWPEDLRVQEIPNP
jgi:protein gp37